MLRVDGPWPGLKKHGGRRVGSGSPAIQLPYDSALLGKAKNALSDEWPKPAVVIGMGGSIPIVGDFQKMLGMESLLVGFALFYTHVFTGRAALLHAVAHAGLAQHARGRQIVRFHRPHPGKRFFIRRQMKP